MLRMTKNAGYFRSGLPYNRLGRGPRPLVIFQGLLFENKPQPGLATWMYRFQSIFREVRRRPWLSAAITTRLHA